MIDRVDGEHRGKRTIDQLRASGGGMLAASQETEAGHAASVLIARLERVPPTRVHTLVRLLVGCATFFDGFTSLAIAYALPELTRLWELSPAMAGGLISIGYAGQLVGALFFGWLAERIGRLRTLGFCVGVYALLNVACIFAPGFGVLMVFRFIQGVGIGGEVPVAGTYINEFAGARRRGRFFLLYELLFQIGLLSCGVAGALLVPRFGWQSIFVVAALPVLLIAPLRLLLPESPRWLVSKGRLTEAARVIGGLEESARRGGLTLPPPAPLTGMSVVTAVVGRPAELFSRFYRPRTLMVWGLWFCAYLVNNGMLTWMPSLYRSMFHLPLRTALAFGIVPNVAGVVSAFAVATWIDTVGRKRWYLAAFAVATVLLLALFLLGARSAVEVMIFASLVYGTIQTITLSLYLYTAELYPTRIRAIGCGCGSAWLRLGSTISPLVVGTIVMGGSIDLVFLFFAAVTLCGALVTRFFAIETSGQVLEALSP